MKNKYPRLLVVLSALILSIGSLWAERVTQEDAALVAANFLNAGDTTSQGAQAPGRNRPIRRVALAEEAQYYVYANANGEGWVMVAANDVVKPILAYSKTGTFSADKMPSNVSHWLGHYDKFIKKLEVEGVAQTEEVAAQWKKLRKAPPSTAKGNVVVDALVQTQWDQGAPYNNLCPGSGSNKSYTGCVATAMAQVMNYWQWPVTGNGSRTYQPVQHVYDDNGNLKETITLYGEQTADFANTTYDWANMKKKHYSSDTQAQKTAISTLMYHCGVATDMMYGTDAYGGSGTYTVNYGDWDWSDSEGDCAQNALYNFFRYKKPTGYMRDGYSSYYSSWTDDKWTAMIKAELDAKRPIMYAGAGSGGGHSFICDGYDDQNYFHFNWGWSGSNDGWYTLSNLVPGSGGAGGGSYSFSEDQDVIIGIEPVQTGHNVVLNGTGCTLSADLRVENGKSLTVTITPTDETYDYTSTTVKLGSSTLTETTHYTLSSDKKTLTVKSTAITGDLSNDLTITVVWTKNRYSYSLMGTNCTEELEGMLDKNNASLNLTVTPTSGYSLADAACWTVEMGSSMLTYGTDFTYNSSTNTFSITTVTGDVTILAEAGRPVTWRADGRVHATNVAVDGKITLPATDPADCASGKVFVGWCTNSSYSSATTAPTFAKTGDTYSVATYYAVYATAGSGGSSAKSYTFNITTSDFNTTSYAANNNEKTSTATASDASTMDVKWTSSNVMQSSSNIQFKKSVGYIYNSTDLGTIKSVTITSSAGTFTTYYGDSEQPSSSTTVGGGYFQIKVGSATGTVSNIAVTFDQTAGGGASYSDYSTACGTPCSNTPEMSFTNASVALTTDDETYTQAVNISGKGSGQTVAYSSSDESIATVNASGVVTLKGVVGSTTITASVAADGDYCAASASYTLNVTAAPIDVTLYYNGTSASLTGQTNPYTLPTDAPYNTAMCSGDWTFAGWYGSEYAKSTTAPTYITQLNATGHAYAVYTTTETVSSAPARATAEANGTKTFAFATIASANNWENSVTYDTVEDAPVTITAEGGGNNGKWYTSGGGSWRMYSGGTVRITVEGGAVTSVTSSPTCDFTISDGEATFSPSARTDFTQIVVNYTISGGGGGSSSVTYYATTPECATPCSNTPEMSFTDATVNKTTDDETYTQVVNISGKGSGQTVAYSSSNENIATVNASGVVTLKGVVGSTTITASVTADGDYCAASASYTLTVTAAPIDVTLHYNGGAATLSDQTPPYTLPTGSPYNTAMCDGGWTFAGWYGSEYAKSTTAPTYITQLNATGHAYAVYTTTVTESSAPARATAEANGTKTFAFATIASANNWENSVTYDTVEDAPVTITAEGGGNNGKWYTSGGGSWRMYSGGTVRITVEDGAVTSVTSSPSCSFTITDGVATFSPTARTDFTQIVVNYTTNGGGGGGGTSSVTYYATTPECVTGCTITPTMSFANETVTKTTDDEVYVQDVTIENKGDGQTVAYSSSNETVATVSNLGGVTLKGVVGSTTITASVAADGEYCAASASYTLNVTVAPIDVTLYYNGTSSTLENQTNPCILPTTGDYVAAMCSGDWTFAGWYGSEYAKSTTAPTYITQLTATGSAYAVYMTTETVSSAPIRKTAAAVGTTLWAEDFSGYSANDVPSGATANSHTGTTVYDNGSVTYSVTNGNGTTKVYNESSTSGEAPELLIAKGSGTLSISGIPTGDASAMTLTFRTNKTSGISVSSGTTGISVGSVTISSGTATCEITNTGNVETFDLTITNSNSSNSREDDFLLVVKTAGSSGGGGTSSVTYYATTPECATPCSNTPEMSFTDATVNKTTDDETYTQAVNISGKGSGQTVAYSSSDESIATVSASGVVTLKGVVGSTTITASVTTDGDYCAASASYTLTVTAAPIDVTLHYYYNDENHTANLNNQQSPYTLPTTGSYVADACDGDWTFAGWYGSEYAKSETAPTYITQLNATGHAYAVYTTTETVSSAPARATAEEGGAVTITTTTANIPTGYGAANTFTEYTFEGYTFKVQQMYLNSGKLQWRASGNASGTGTMYNTQTFPGKITSIVLTYNSSDGNKNFTVNVGSSENPTSGTSITPSVSGSVYTFDCSSANADYFVLANGTGAGYLDQIVINYGGSGGGGGSSSVTYYATTPECVTPCSITPTMSFANETVTKTTDDEAYVQYVTIENKGDGQTVAYSSSNETVATVSNLGGVTLNGVVGSTTITASVAADGDYCEASASYTITVTACALTGITLNTDNAKTVFLVGDQLTTDGVVVTANYSNCEDKIVEPDGFTYPGNITMEPGTKQVTAHYAEASATYDVTVVAPYTVTWKACGEVFDTQTYAPGAALELPSSTPGGNAGKSFVGWTATVHYTGASAPPDMFSTAGDKTVTANVTYYAVYK